MIEIKISADSVDSLRTAVVALAAQLNAVSLSSDVGVTDLQPQPAKRTRKPKADATADQIAVDPRGVDAATATAREIPGVKSVTTESLFATVDVPAPAKQPEQKDLIAAFRALNEKKGTDAIVGLLGKFGAKTVALIPKDKWAEAIAEASKLAA